MDYSDKIIRSHLNEDQQDIMTEFKNQIKEEIEVFEKEKSDEKKEFEDDLLLLKLVQDHALRDSISIGDDEPELDEFDCEENDAAEIDNGLKLYINKIKVGIIPILKKM